jgi:hypothetical protein
MASKSRTEKGGEPQRSPPKKIPFQLASCLKTLKQINVSLQHYQVQLGDPREIVIPSNKKT